jgi:hypothetical protein
MEMTATTRSEESVVEPIDVEISAKGMFLPALVGYQSKKTQEENGRGEQECKQECHRAENHQNAEDGKGGKGQMP